MSLLKASRTAQYPLTKVFEWAFGDTMVDTAGVTKDFGAASLAAVVDVINLPPNAVVVGGHLAVKTAFDTAGYDVIVGDSADTDRYMATADVKAVGITPLLTPGYVNTGGLPIRVTIATDDVCTTGVARLTVNYIIQDRVQEID